MEVTCTHCKAKLNIPDEKIPKDQMVRVNCPKCKNKITIEPHKTAQEKPPPEDSFTETGKMHLKFIESKREKPGEKEGPGFSEAGDDEEALDFFDEDAKLSLVMVGDNDNAEKVKTAVEELGYKYISSPNTRDALGKLRFHHFDMVFLADGFDGQELGNSPIRNFLNHISMSSRRRIFLALMGDQFKTMDDMMAFAMSANTVINTTDVDRLPTVLKKGISEHEKFYKVYMDTLAEVGKA
ncbi:zinc-ribbon domain-containing protein [Thermodesulfobacteriota bacterium]